MSSGSSWASRNAIVSLLVLMAARYDLPPTSRATVTGP
jgi:hypothetical protein